MDNYKNKTILVTGATGLIGSNLVKELIKVKGSRVIALGRNIGKLQVAFNRYLENKNIAIIEHDISLPLNINERVDYIFHAAGPMESKIIRDYPLDVIRPNILGTINCLDLLKKQDETFGNHGRLILFSSVTVYGNCTNEDLIVNEGDTSITEKLDSVSAPYSQSKRLSEVIASSFCKQYGVDVVIGRFSTVYGCTTFIPNTAFFEFIQNALDGENIVLNNANLPKRDNIYIEDAVRGILTVGAKGKTGEAYNISSNGDGGNFASVGDIANIIIQIANEKYDSSSGLILKDSTVSKQKPGISLENSKLKSLGWKISTNLSNGIEIVLDEFYNNKYNSEGLK